MVCDIVSRCPDGCYISLDYNIGNFKVTARSFRKVTSKSLDLYTMRIPLLHEWSFSEHRSRGSLSRYLQLLSRIRLLQRNRRASRLVGANVGFSNLSLDPLLAIFHGRSCGEIKPADAARVARPAGPTFCLQSCNRNSAACAILALSLVINTLTMM